ncbi:hypothetical protein DFJ58DRAFT_914105 [Suillus subalutaceus]|uniref:uncharacterized protein n=1 Tax=Suillus subalutaceus TaxID=48586 RepID=UPI001B880AE7|nr:uncharacterized protein DFJ58DRAFT_914105 [Suillus subalutaceus]KAG1854194.1 hypothetical protein DFJ58DRAFT_914105 [Suillus subalutaceus]
MLLQRLRILEPTLEAVIAYNLVDLAVVAPEESSIDVQVLATQTRLARELDQRPDLYDVYLVELLTLFGDKGVAIQNVATSARHVKTTLYTWPLRKSLWASSETCNSSASSSTLHLLIPVLAKIATKTPTLVLENAHDACCIVWKGKKVFQLSITHNLWAFEK